MSNVAATGQTANSAKPPCAPLVVATTRFPAHASAPVPARVDDAHDLHARAVRQLGPHHHVAAGDALEVVEVERDRLHPHPHLAGPGSGIGAVVELQHLERLSVPVHPPGAHFLVVGHSQSWRARASALEPLLQADGHGVAGRPPLSAAATFVGDADGCGSRRRARPLVSTVSPPAA